MGGLWKKMKITAITFMIASGSISGIFPLSGFWSKDEIVATTVHHPIFMVLTLVIAFMTAFYMWRLCFLTFTGSPRDQHRYDHAHESPGVMTYPLMLLAFLSIFAGWVGIPALEHGFAAFVYHEHAYHPHFNWGMALLSTVVALSGVGLAYLMYYKRSISPEKVAAALKPLYKLTYNKYYFDEIYQVIIINPLMAFGRLMWSFDARVIDGFVNLVGKATILWAQVKQWFDVWIVDGAVNGSGWIVRKGASILRYLQTGSLQFYILFIMTIVVIFGMYKFESSLINISWPALTLVFVVGLAFLSIVAKMVQARIKPEQDSEGEE
jgi:NADH-quinone oxidoreductase subunit L